MRTLQKSDRGGVYGIVELFAPLIRIVFDGHTKLGKVSNPLRPLPGEGCSFPILEFESEPFSPKD